MSSGDLIRKTQGFRQSTGCEVLAWTADLLICNDDNNVNPPPGGKVG